MRFVPSSNRSRRGRHRDGNLPPSEPPCTIDLSGFSRLVAVRDDAVPCSARHVLMHRGAERFVTRPPIRDRPKGSSNENRDGTAHPVCPYTCLPECSSGAAGESLFGFQERADGFPIEPYRQASTVYRFRPEQDPAHRGDTFPTTCRGRP